MSFQIEGIEIGESKKTYLIAEVGTTANGSVETAKKLIDVVKEAGFDAVKFQNISPKDYMSDRKVMYKFKNSSGAREENMFEMLEKLTFSKDQWQQITAYASKCQMTCFATVNWLGGVEMMEELKTPAYKIASWDLNYPDLQRKIFSTGKPVFIDLGPVDILEVIKIRKLAQSCGNNKVVFLYDFHTNQFEEMHMNGIQYLKRVLMETVGFSSPGKESELDLVSLGLGAKVLEKRVTLNDQDSGHHHFLAICGAEVPKWVSTVRQIEKALGRMDLIPSGADLADSKKYFRGITATKNIKKGEKFSSDNLGAKRPMGGISPEYLGVIWGQTAKADIELDSQILWDKVEFSK